MGQNADQPCSRRLWKVELHFNGLLSQRKDSNQTTWALMPVELIYVSAFCSEWHINVHPCQVTKSTAGIQEHKSFDDAQPCCMKTRSQTRKYELVCVLEVRLNYASGFLGLKLFRSDQTNSMAMWFKVRWVIAVLGEKHVARVNRPDWKR